MVRLNLPEYSFRIRNTDKGKEIFDPIRKKFVSLTPEEWVRQNFIQYLISEKNYSSALIAVESGLRFNKLKKRCDITVYDRKGKKWMLIECKAPEVKLTQAAFDQVATYNASGKEKVPYLAVTNGLKHYCCELSAESGHEYRFLKDFPNP